MKAETETERHTCSGPKSRGFCRVFINYSLLDLNSLFSPKNSSAKTDVCMSSKQGKLQHGPWREEMDQPQKEVLPVPMTAKGSWHMEIEAGWEHWRFLGAHGGKEAATNNLKRNRFVSRSLIPCHSCAHLSTYGLVLATWCQSSWPTA